MSHQCIRCPGLLFATEESLRLHYQTVQESRDFDSETHKPSYHQCSYCFVGTTYFEDLLKHQTRACPVFHPSGREYDPVAVDGAISASLQCSTVKSFIRSMDKIIGEERNPGNHWYRCPAWFCRKRKFYTLASLRKHMAVMFESTNFVSESHTPLQLTVCRYCLARFGSGEFGTV